MLTIGNIPVNKSIKKVIITGGCGFIGSHIAKALQQHGGYRVVVIDHVQRAHTLKYINEFIQCDYDSKSAYSLIDNLQPDAIIHCAGSLLVGESVVNPALYYHNNVSKTINFLQKCLLNDEFEPPSIVFSSSAAVYGNPLTLPVTEDNAIQPINPYGHTKAMIEQVLADYDRAYNLKSVCLRYFNACGAEPFESDLGQVPGASHIIARLLDARLNNESFTLNGTDFNTKDGTCVRDYIHAWDLATAHIRALEYLFAGGESVRLNLGTNTGISNQEIINKVLEIAGPIDIRTGERREGDPDVLIADATRAQKLLNWYPVHSDLNTIVDSAWKWYQSR